MTLIHFNVCEPHTIEEACSLLGQYRSKAKFLAGGTDLLVSIRKGTFSPELLVNLKKITELYGIKERDRDLVIGALTSLHEVETSSIVQSSHGALVEALHVIGSIQIRNTGTLGGNICSAIPSADSPPILIALGARVKISSKVGEREIPLADFFNGPGRTVLAEDELLKEICIPKREGKWGAIYLKQSRIAASDIAIVGIAVALSLNPATQRCQDIAIVMGAVAPIPLRARKAETILKDEVLKDEMIEDASLVASKEAKPISDLRGSDHYRTQLIQSLAKSAIKRAMERALDKRPEGDRR